MPGNSLIVRDYTNPVEVRKLRISESMKSVQEIADHINNRRVLALGGRNRLKDRLYGLLTSTVAKYIYKTPRKFRVTSGCIHCRICEQICPTKNIKLSSDKNPHWGNNCTQCLACFHWCPQRAVEIGSSTTNKPRYTHPDISIADIIKNRTSN